MTLANRRTLIITCAGISDTHHVLHYRKSLLEITNQDNDPCMKIYQLISHPPLTYNSDRPINMSGMLMAKTQVLKSVAKQRPKPTAITEDDDDDDEIDFQIGAGLYAVGRPVQKRNDEDGQIGTIQSLPLERGALFNRFFR